MTSFEQVQQEHPMKLHHLSTSSESSITSFEQAQQDHPLNFQQPITSSESSVTGFETVDPIKTQIDNFQPTELSKMADSFGEPTEFCETHM